MKIDFSEMLEKIEKAVSLALPADQNSGWVKNSFGKVPTFVAAKYFEELALPGRHLVSLGGKRWRPLLLVLMSQFARKTNAASSPECVTLLAPEDVYKITPLVEFVHTASLIHDDIEDAADMRRGEAAAHILYGTDRALNAASWLYFEAAACLESLPLAVHARAIYYALYAEQLRRLHLGQAMDIFWHSHQDEFPTNDEYFFMTKCKTGTLAAFAAQAGLLAGGASLEAAEKAGEIAAELGVAFQVLDDVQNLTSGNPGKKRGDDIVEGKKSLPILLHAQKFPEDKEKISQFFVAARKNGIEDGSVEACIDLLCSSGAVDEAKQFGLNLIEEKSRELTGNCECEEARQIHGLFESLAKKFEGQNG